MAVSIKPLTKKDYANSGGLVSTTYSKNNSILNPDGLDSKKIFGDFKNKKDIYQHYYRDNLRGYMHLEKPVINPLYCNGSSKLIALILGIESDVFKEIRNCTVMFDASSETYINRNEIESDEDVSKYLFNAEIIEYLIKKFDLEESRLNEFKNVTGAEDFKPDDLTYNLTDKQRDKLVKNLASGSSRLTFLLLIKDKSIIENIIMRDVMVMPPGLRPDMGRQKDQFTKKYKEIKDASDNLGIAIRNDYTYGNFVPKYLRLVREVTELIYKSNSSQNTKSVIEKLNSKNGQVRNDNLGKRTDYSGRSVIVVNPNLSVNQCGLPKQMIPILYRYHHAVRSKLSYSQIKKMNMDDAVKDIVSLGILNDVPAALNRAPTLHTLGYLGYYPIISKSKAIELHVLACGGMNADFDGDTEAVHIPLSAEAIYEMQTLMLSTNNMFIPANGKCTLIPRQEMIYGLNTASTVKYAIKEVSRIYADLDELQSDIKKDMVDIDATVSVEGIVGTAGAHLIRWCLPRKMRDRMYSENKVNIVTEITKSTIEDYVNELLTYKKKTFIKSLDRIVAVGFLIATYYAPTISLFDDFDDEADADPFANFHENMKDTVIAYENGFESPESYNLKFDSEFSIVEELEHKRIMQILGPDNGFARLVESGARGTKDNLIQIYRYKGRIAKSSSESFSSIIESSMVDQLNPLEHYISAFGARKGLIDKTNKTGETGYADRRMWHSTEQYIIRTEDCGAVDGIVISKADLVNHIQSAEDKVSEATTIMYNIIVGRYEAKTNRYITKELAKELSQGGEVEIRSVYTCKNKCCAKCYGMDLTINGEAVVGAPVGIIAAQSLGEAATQLTMRTFHSGGIAGKSDITSDFDRFTVFIDMQSIKKQLSATYDPLAWATGEIIETPKDEYNKIVEIKGSEESIEVNINARLKSMVKAGEGICVAIGDHDIDEYVKYNGFEKAKIYLTYLMYFTYLGKASINFKHFEMVVSSLVMNLILKSNNENLVPAKFYTDIELCDNKGIIVYEKYFVGMKRIQQVRSSLMSNIQMERVAQGLAWATLKGNEYNYDSTIGNLILGLVPPVGTGYNKNYIKQRLEREMCKND